MRVAPMKGLSEFIKYANRLAFVWFLSMAAFYAWTVARTTGWAWKRELLSALPLFWFWIVAAILAVSLIVVVFVSSRRRFALPAILGISSISLVLVSGKLVSAFVACWIMLLATAIGTVILKWLRVNPRFEKASERLPITIGLGLTILALGGVALGLAGQMKPVPIIAFLALMSLIAALTIDWTQELRILGALPTTRDLREALVSVPLAGVLLFSLAGALLPENQFDALNYQLAVPRFWLESGHIADLGYFYHSYFARLLNVDFALAMALGGQTAAKLLVFGCSFMAAIGVFGLGTRLFNREVGFWSFALFLSTPLIVWLSTTAYIDAALAMFLVAVWLAFFKYLDHCSRKWLIITGLLSGAAIGVKLIAAFGLPIVLIGIAFGRDKSSSWRSRAVDIIVYCVAAFLTSSVWFALPFYFTGNPIFPMLSSTGGDLGRSAYGIGISLVSLLKLPFAVTFETSRFVEGIQNGGLGISFALVPVAIITGLTVIRSNRMRVLALAAVILYGVCWALSIQAARFLIPVLGFVAVLALGTVLNETVPAGVRRAGQWIIALIIAVQVSFSAFRGLHLDATAALSVLLQRESEAEYLRRVLPVFRTVEATNTSTEPDDFVLGESLDNVRYYVKARLVSYEETREVKRLATITADDELARQLDRLGYRVLVMEKRAVASSRNYLQPSFLEKYATMLFNDGRWFVYKLKVSN